MYKNKDHKNISSYLSEFVAFNPIINNFSSADDRHNGSRRLINFF